MAHSIIQDKNIFFQIQPQYNNQCGMFALNNILGQDAYNCQNLNEICASLSQDIINPHKHIFGGDYDVNILMIALQQKGYQIKWVNNQKKEELTQIHFENNQIYGYLINKQMTTTKIKTFFKTVLGFSDRHWLAVKKIDNKFFILDSKRQRPEQISDIYKYIAIQMQMASHVLEVTKKRQQI